MPPPPARWGEVPRQAAPPPEAPPVAPLLGAALPSRRRTRQRRAREQRQDAPDGAAGTASRDDLETLNPLRLEHSRSRRRDEAARVAVVDGEGLTVQLQCQQGVRMRRELGGRTLVANAPSRSSDVTKTSESAGASTSAIRSATGTPVHVAPALQPSTHAIGSDRVRWGIASSSPRLSCSVVEPYPSVNRQPASRAASSTPACSALRLIGTPCGPSPERTPKIDTSRSHETDCPAVERTARPAAAYVARRRPRREITPARLRSGPCDEVTSAGSSTSLISARRMIGSFTATWTTIDPIATHATA